MSGYSPRVGACGSAAMVSPAGGGAGLAGAASKGTSVELMRPYFCLERPNSAADNWH